MRKLSVLLSLVLVGFGCSDDDPAKSNNGNNNTFDVGETNNGNGDMDGFDVGNQGTITFTLRNDTELDLWAGVGAGTSGCSSFPFVHVQGIDAEPRLRKSCDICTCGDSQCSVCDCAGAGPESFRFAPGQERTFTWDKVFWELEFEDGRCVTPRDAMSSRYTAQFCFTDTFDEESVAPVRNLCQTVEFDIDDQEVTYAITDDAIPTGFTEFRLINNTSEPIFAMPSVDMCLGTWFGLNRSGEGLRLDEQCGVCDCSDGTDCNEPCPAAPCPAPTRADLEIPAGEMRSFTWDHVFWQTRDLEGSTCEWPAFAAPGDTVTIEACYATTITEDGASAGLENPVCEIKEFGPNDTQVDFVVE